ncbi:DUF1499 domain-containing protein [Roseibium sp.]|uniref:DUF1499 domain-containing protein n=1 Tax=Roseibium sp. TaxID=1936156 RepID=UPI003B52A369
MKRYPDHKSRAAPASRSFGAVAFALALITVLGMRFGLVTPDIFVLSLAAAAVLAVLALICALTAFLRIWSLGGSGIGSSILGGFLGLLALSAPVAVLGMLVVKPELTDVSTDPDDPPFLIEFAPKTEQAVLVWAMAIVQETGWVSIKMPVEQTRSLAEMQFGLYPDIVPRRYRISPGELHAASKKAVETLRWRIIDELPPDLLDAPTALWAEETTQVLGLKHDVALRVRPDPVGALLDVRARSQSPLRELSSNADVIRSVLSEVDKVLLETYGNLERLAVEEADLEDEIPLETYEPERKTVPLPGFKPFFETEEGLSADAFELDDLEG